MRKLLQNLSAFCCLLVSMQGKTVETLAVYQSSDNEMSLVEYSVKKSAYVKPEILELGFENRTINTLYPVQYTKYIDGIEFVSRIVKVPHLELSDKTVHKLTVNSDNHGVGLEVVKTLHKNAEKYAETNKRWRDLMKNQLLQAMKVNEDHEAELLLYMKFFKEMLVVESDGWKQDTLSKFVFSICGLNDIQDAVPNRGKFLPKNHILDQPLPKPITLPQINTPTKPVDPSINTAAKFVPRSCYYLEIKDFDSLFKTANYASEELEAWTGRLYPKSINDLVETYIQKLAITEDLINKLNPKMESLVVSGWDPYFQTGTNLLAIITLKSEEKIKINSRYSFQMGKHLVIATCPKLLKMSQKASEGHKNLYGVKNFQYARTRLKKVDNENEELFLYLSDYWFTNFVSPRWRINTRRSQEAMAKIRFAEILRFVDRLETKTKMVPSLDDMKKKYKDNPQISWILSSLKENKRTYGSAYPVIYDAKIGELYDQIAVDELPFDKVSKAEAEYYEKFSVEYRRRWEKMDPLAFQLTSVGDSYKTRLYISPIGRRSYFRELRRNVVTQKQSHSIKAVTGQAAGISVMLKSRLFSGFFRGLDLPVAQQISLGAFDFAPSSLKTSEFLKEPSEKDILSYFRAPVFVEIPTVITERLMTMVGRESSLSSNYKDISVNDIPIARNELTKLFVHNSKEGMSYVTIEPSSAVRVRDGLEGGITKAAVPSDLYLFIDAKFAYTMRHKLLHEAIENRCVANWRRQNRMTRISFMSGSRMAAVKNYYENRAVFPSINGDYSGLIGGMPKFIDRENAFDYGTNASEKFDLLPRFLRNLQRVDMFISVEDNALFFENHLKYQSPKKVEQAVEEVNEVEDDFGLDFDE